MNRGKVICKELKAVRKRIAEENNIPLEIKECTYEGPCRGTCPRCEAEVRYLENSLAHRLKMGKVATIAGLTLGLASCGGGQAERTDTLLRPTSSSTSPSLGEVQMPEVPEGPSEIIDVPDMGEIEICGDVENVPPLSEMEGVVEPLLPDELLEGEESIESLFTVVDDEPEFLGGKEALDKFINDNLQYPRLALENNITGKVYVTFVVEKDGSISNPRLLRDIGGGCGKEAIRLVKLMPKWKPGEQQGKPVRVQYNLPVRFELPPMIEEATLGGIPEPAPFYKPDPPVESPKGPDAPTQQMRVDGVKVIVK